MIAERDDDRHDRPRLAEPLRQGDRGDLGRFVLEGFDEGRRLVVVRDRRVERGCGLHRTRPYRTGPLVDPLTMVLMTLSVRAVLLAHAGRSRVAALAAGSTRPLPRTRLTPFAIGVQSRTK